MLESHRIANLAVIAATEDIVDGIRLIRDSIITVEPNKDGYLRIASPLLEGKTINEAAEELRTVLETSVPSQSSFLAWELVYIAGEDGEAPADFLIIHDALDSAVADWEQNQKQTEFLIDDEDL